MDYKALVAQGKYVGGRMDSGLERDVVFSLCDAVEALGKALEERTCVDCGKPMVCGGWCVNDPLE